MTVNNHFCVMLGDNISIHPSSIVDDGAVIGSGTRIWHFCHLMPGSSIGNNCILGQNVYIDKNVLIGNGVKIQNNVSVYDGVTIEDDVFLGPSVVFTNVKNPRSFIERKKEFKKTVIKKGATIGANTTILCGIEVGSYALIGAGSVVINNVPAFALMVGNPAGQIGWVSINGKTLIFDNGGIGICPETGQKYKLENQTVKPMFSY
jgi:UDP-2-acetamido-3-amino-2,3-dideoxy-glucuronate N-acetyltransferase